MLANDKFEPASRKVPEHRSYAPDTLFLISMGGAGHGLLGGLWGPSFGRFGYSAILPSMQEGLGITSAAAGSLASWNWAGIHHGCGVDYSPRGLAPGSGDCRSCDYFRWYAAYRAFSQSGYRLGWEVHYWASNGMVLVPSIALMASWFEKRRLGFASSVVSSGSSLACTSVLPCHVSSAAGSRYLAPSLVFLRGRVHLSQYLMCLCNGIAPRRSHGAFSV